MLGPRAHPLPSSLPHGPALVFDEIWGLPIFDVLTCQPATQSRDESRPNWGSLWFLLSLSISSQLRSPPHLSSLFPTVDSQRCGQGELSKIHLALSAPIEKMKLNLLCPS